jgi:hypothetical protein
LEEKEKEKEKRRRRKRTGNPAVGICKWYIASHWLGNHS